MFNTTTLPYKTSGVLNKLVFDYLSKQENVKPFYSFFPDKEGFRSFLAATPYAAFDRETLPGILLRQGQRVANTSEPTKNNVLLLNQKNTYTVTTGHQLCLFTGPLYFIYKIFSTINLAEELKKEFPGSDFVPVYWMASEDHDFEEVNHVNLFGRTLKWETSQSGAVGDFKTAGLHELLPQLGEIFGNSPHAPYLTSLFKNAYLGHSNLSDATRFLVNELFGKYGLVIADGNDKAFKEQFKAEFRKDIFENACTRAVSGSIESLEQQGYSIQVTPRPINCFYMEDGLRARIEKKDGQFNIVGTEKTFTETELRELIDAHPEKISPNVVLRPLYQQKILPNIAYVGGPGELAYWLEFKSLFAGFGHSFPILVPRNFVTVADAATLNKIHKLGFTLPDFFKSPDELVQEFQQKNEAVFDLEKEKKDLADYYAQITAKISGIDKTLSGSVSAELQKTLNSLDMLAGKANKALKQRSETEITQIRSVKQKLFPGGVPQERHDNFAALYLKYGAAFFEALKATLLPFHHEQVIVAEKTTP